MKISLTKLSVKDLATLAQRILDNIQSGKYPVIDNHPLAIALQTSYAEYDKVYAKQKFSGKGEDVATADLERDAAYSALKGYLNGYRKLTTLTDYELAGDLYEVFKTFGLGVDRLTYSSQTAQMKKLIEALNEPANYTKIVTLKLKEALTDMKNKHENFEVMFGDQAEANAALRNTTSASAIRKFLENDLKAYTNLLTVMKGVSGWDMLYSDTNELVKSAKNSDHE